MLEVVELFFQLGAHDDRVLEHVLHVGGQIAVFTAHFAPFRHRSRTGRGRRQASPRSCRGGAARVFAIRARLLSMDLGRPAFHAAAHKGNKTAATNNRLREWTSPPSRARSMLGTRARRYDTAAASLGSQAHIAARTSR